VGELHFLNTSSVVITGGEPLMYEGIVGLVKGVSREGLDLTLSTTGADPNGLLRHILPHINQLGIPIDAADTATNAKWRRSKLYPDGGLDAAIEALKLATSGDFGVEDITVRTLAMSHNVDMLPEIPELLLSRGIDISRVRWKIYELMTDIGPRKGRSIHFHTETEQKIVSLTNTDMGFASVVYKRAEDSNFGYFIIDPTGNARIVIRGENGPEDLHLGNIFQDFEQVVVRMNVDYATYLARMSNAAYANLSEFFGELTDEKLDPERVLTDIETGILDS
jgi:MoaA/NifB/PqqE/SkfB family radical SAM enzyme